MPANSRPTPNINTTKTPVLIWNTIAKEPKMRASTARPIVPHFDLCPSNILLMILSPTIIQTIDLMIDYIRGRLENMNVLQN
jgi:hypothetical protein